MSNDEPDFVPVYTRLRGRTMGPFTLAQLKLLHQRGQFSRAHEISEDRQAWRSAATLESAFQTPRRRATTTSTATLGDDSAMAATAPALAVSKPSWHYSIDGDTQGPVTTIDLRGLITSGQLCSMDLVWKEGMAGWAPAGDIDELQVSFDLQAATTSRAPATSGTSQERAGAGQHYCFACGSPADSRAEICPKCGVRQPGKSRSTKNRITAALFAFFLGGFGVHHFYLGNVVQGVVYLVFFWTLIPWFIAFIEGIILLFTSDEQFGLRYPSSS